MFYGWRVVFGTFVSQLFLTGFFTYAISLLILPVREEFGVNLETVMYSMSAGILFGLVFTPPAGILIDRMSNRWLMIWGALSFAVGLWAMAHAQTIWQYILIFGITKGLANALAGAIACSAIVSRWFTTSRGRALGFSAMGTSAGGIAIPFLVSAWLPLHGWRTTLEYLALTVLLVMLPIIILTVRGKPSDVSLAAEGGVDLKTAESAPPESMPVGEVIKNPAYWYLGFSLGILFSTYSSILTNISPYAMDLGENETSASWLITAIAVSSVLGKILFGFAADTFSLKHALWASQLLVLCGFLMLAIEPPYFVMTLACIALGLASGGMLPVWGSMTARIFGLASFGRAMGLMSPLLTLCFVPGFTAAGALYDATGSYSPVLYCFAAATVIAAILVVPMQVPEEPSNPASAA